jgi:hypothetical protein
VAWPSQPEKTLSPSPLRNSRLSPSPSYASDPRITEKQALRPNLTAF